MISQKCFQTHLITGSGHALGLELVVISQCDAKSYANITREYVDLFKSYCVPCQEPQT